MNVPKLRFKEFNDEWIKQKFKEFTYYSGKRNKENLNLVPYAITNNFGFIPQSLAHNEFGYMKNTDRRAYNIVTPFSFAYNPARINVGSIGYYNGKKNIIVSSLYEVFKTKEYIDDKFLWYWLKSDIFPIWINRLQEGSVRQYFYYDKLCEVSLYYPTFIEQTKIAQFLSLLDKKIELQTKKIEALKLFKKGLLNSFFQNKQPNVTIENCISYGKAGGTPSSKNKDYYDGNIPFLSISDMTSQKKYILKTEKSISQQGIKNSSAWIVPKNSIILSMYASYGLITINKIELSTSQAMFSMIVNSKNNIEYIYYYLEFLYNNNYYDRLVSIGTQANLNADKVKKIKIYLPDINSQNKISKILKLCDERIEYENKKEFELRKFKQGLMQNMFV